MNAATMQVTSEPAKVSTLPNLMSCRSRPLSTTALCWKKICHGVMVVPMLARMMKSMSPVSPPTRLGTRRPWATDPQPGAAGVFIAQKAAGM